jgi:CHAT domain-containing protein/tetratricopeptide (TPR) repeat protein
MASGIRDRSSARATVPVAFVALLLTACADRAGRQLDDVYQEALLALRRGQLPTAQALADKGHADSAVRGAAAGTEWATRFRLLSAEISINNRDLAAAASILERPVPERAGLDALRGRHDYLHARIQVLRGQAAAAMETLARARTLASTDIELQHDIDVLVGQLRLQLGRWDEGEAVLAAVAKDAAMGGDLFHEAVAYGNLGMGRLIRNRCDEALAWFELVLDRSELETMSVYSAALSNAGACYARLGQLDRAVNVQKRAVALYEHRESRREYEQALGELGSTYLLRDDIQKAVPYLERALTIATDANVPEDAALWARNLASAYIQGERWDDAERANVEAIRLNPPSRASKRVWNTLHAARIAAGRGQIDEARRLFAEAVSNEAGGPSVTWAAHDGLAGLAVREGRRAQAAHHFEASLATIEKTRSDLLKADYKLSFLTQLIRFYRAYVDVLVAQGDVERALEIADSSRGRVLAERHGVKAPAPMDAGAMKRLARDTNAVLLSFWLAPERSFVWAIDAAGVRLRELPGSDEIEKLVRAHQAAIGNSLSNPLSATDTPGARLFDALVKPIADTLPGGATIIIVPDGVLHGLNFETLPVDDSRGGPRHYWIEDAVIQIAPSLGMLIGEGRQPAEARSLLVFGNAAPREPDFPALRYASHEMDSIARHFAGGHVSTYEAERASPAAFRSAQAERFGLIHFTAHAAANAESPLDSAIVLSGPEHGFKLYARDVADLPLRAELVTVSACRSAGGRAYAGEGLVGFAWAFLRAGARRVIAGLWDVDDRSTAELMDLLYARLATGERAPDALRHAKLSLLARGDHFSKPYYWAPFQLFTVVP